jgi:hypothetical protein
LRKTLSQDRIARANTRKLLILLSNMNRLEPFSALQGPFATLERVLDAFFHSKTLLGHETAKNPRSNAFRTPFGYCVTSKTMGDLSGNIGCGRLLVLSALMLTKGNRLVPAA